MLSLKKLRFPLQIFVPIALCVFCLPNLSRQTAKSQPSNGHQFALDPIDVPPVVEPLAIKAIDSKDAAAINRSVPFAALVGPAAQPFFLPTSDTSDRATDCLAAAVYYEAAGEGEAGERAVAQVILNRVRHPAFPKTVCGVVFQGSERPTGCQFTFTCDGALIRKPSATGWTFARSIALSALKGKVYAPVGYATHFHTQWVVPAWRTELDKLVQIGAHIFYRWSGTWGRPRAFYGAYTGSEAQFSALASLSAAHAEQAAGDPPVAIAPNEQQPAGWGDGQEKSAYVTPGKTLVVTLDPAQGADGFPAVARTACGAAQRCTFLGWTTLVNRPKSTTVSVRQYDTMSFSYFRDYATKTEKLEWNCREFKDRDIRHCLKVPLLADLEAQK